MDSIHMEKLIRNLGCSYDALVSNKVIENLPLVSLYEDGETLEIEPAPGIELVFWPDTLRYEMLYITIIDELEPTAHTYKGDLPPPYNSLKDKNEVHSKLGKPIYSKSPMELLGTSVYGWDTYQVDKGLHPAALIDLQYTQSMQIGKVFFSLPDKNV